MNKEKAIEILSEEMNRQSLCAMQYAVDDNDEIFNVIDALAFVINYMKENQ